MKKCIFCKINKPFTDYHKRSVSPDGFDNRCKECRRFLVNNPQGLEDADEKNRIPAEEILEAMGYELYNPDRPIWEQFRQRIIDKKGIDLFE